MKKNMHKDVTEILVTYEEIEEICEKLGKQISSDYKTDDLVVVGILKGAIPFLTLLTFNIDINVQIEYMQTKSYYGGHESTGTTTITHDLEVDIKGRDILIVEDIVDSGRSLKLVKEHLYNKGAKSVKVCALVTKEKGTEEDVVIDYVGKVIPNKFIIGFGLDYQEKYRNLKYIGVLDPKVYGGK